MTDAEEKHRVPAGQGQSGVLDEVGREGESPGVAGSPGTRSVTDEGAGRHRLGPCIVDDGAVGVAVETQGDRSNAEGIEEGLGEVAGGAEAPVVVVAVFAGMSGLGDHRGEVVDGTPVVVGAGGVGHG